MINQHYTPYFSAYWYGNQSSIELVFTAVLHINAITVCRSIVCMFSKGLYLELYCTCVFYYSILLYVIHDHHCREHSKRLDVY